MCFQPASWQRIVEPRRKLVAEDVVLAENNKYQNSKYFGQLVDIFDNLPDTDSKRTFCSALIVCFDPKEGLPTAPSQVCTDHGFAASKPKAYRFVLAKKHARQFFIEDCEWPSVSSADIRKLSKQDYVDRFSREPFIRGRSTYWLTLAEWIVLLEAPGTAPLPTKIHDFAESQNLLD